MPGPVRAFAENQPVTSIVNTIRALFEQQPVGGEIWIALAWCVGILVIAASSSDSIDGARARSEPAGNQGGSGASRRFRQKRPVPVPEERRLRLDRGVHADRACPGTVPGERRLPGGG